MHNESTMYIMYYVGIFIFKRFIYIGSDLIFGASIERQREILMPTFCAHRQSEITTISKVLMAVFLDWLFITILSKILYFSFNFITLKIFFDKMFDSF